jgi:hypothetical protein
MGSWLPFPPANRVHRGLDKHRVPTLHIYQLGIAVVTNYGLNCYNSGKAHGTGHLRVKGHYTVDDLPLALCGMIGSKSTKRRERRAQCE